MNQVKEDVITYIYSKKDALISRWKHKVFIPYNTFSEETIEDNNHTLFQIFLQALSLSDQERNDYIQSQVQKMVQLETLNPTSTSHFVYNINVVKNEILKELNNFKENCDELKSIQLQVTKVIDELIYYTLHFSTEIKAIYRKQTTQQNLAFTSFIHEIKNPLTVVQGFAQLLHSDYPDLPYIDIILQELEQIKMKAYNFLQMAKLESNSDEKSLITLNEVVNESLQMFDPKIKETHLSLEKNLNHPLPIIGNKNELRQVFDNLLLNALDALEEEDSNRFIRITGYSCNQSVFIKIANSGPKIPQQLIQSIFDPFVTTKKSGTGIGLFVCKSIINRHHGDIFCTSNDEETVFTIVLPLAKQFS